MALLDTNLRVCNGISRSVGRRLCITLLLLEYRLCYLWRNNYAMPGIASYYLVLNKMKVYFIGFLFFGFLISCGSNDKKRKQVSKNIDDYFINTYQVVIDTMISTVNSFDVNDSGEWLILDRRRKQVLLTDSLQQPIKNIQIEARNEFPGINWSPTNAYFMKNGQIMVTNNYPWAIKFDSDGNFLESMPQEFRVSADLAFDQNSNTYSFVSNYLGTFIDKYSSDGNHIKRIPISDIKFKNIVDRAIVGNSMSIINNELYFKSIEQARILKFSLSGRLIDQYSELPAYYGQPTEDIRILSSDGSLIKSKLSSEMRLFAMNNTANFSIHSLSNELLLIQYVNMGGYYGIQILNTSGEYILDKDLVIREKVYTAKDGYIYTIDNFRKDSVTGEYLQPLLKKYKFKHTF